MYTYFKNISNVCDNFISAYNNHSNPSDEEISAIEYLNIDLAKAIIQNLDPNNAEHIANIILGYVGK